MLVTIYYPFMDERALFPGRSDLVESRFTRLGEPHRFTRNLGKLVDRPRGGFQGWIGENTICAVHQSVVIQFDKWPEAGHLKVAPKVAFKRLFFDGLRGYFSIGISMSGDAENTTDGCRLVDLLRALSTVPVMSSHRPGSPSTLTDFSELALDLYASGSVKKLRDLSSGSYKQHIHFARPTMIVSMIGRQDIEVGTFQHRLALDLRSPFHGSALGQQTSGGFINWPDPTFVLAITSRTKSDAANSRFLRVGVARLYLETYAFERMITVLQGPLFAQCDEQGQLLIGEAVNASLVRLHGANRPDIASNAESYDGLVASFARIFRPGHVSDLENVLTRLRARPNLRKALEKSLLVDGQSSIAAITKLEVIMGNKVEVTGTAGNVVGGNIENSNIVGGPQSVTYSRQEITTALSPVAAAIAQAPADKAGQAKQTLKELEEEVAKGTGATDSVMAKLVDGLVGLVPAAVTAVVSAFGTPILGGIAGPATKYVLDKIQGK